MRRSAFTPTDRERRIVWQLWHLSGREGGRRDLWMTIGRGGRLSSAKSVPPSDATRRSGRGGTDRDGGDRRLGYTAASAVAAIEWQGWDFARDGLCREMRGGATRSLGTAKGELRTRTGTGERFSLVRTVSLAPLVTVTAIGTLVLLLLIPS